jgi:Ca2+-binding EF-hand superfamily protein
MRIALFCAVAALAMSASWAPPAAAADRAAAFFDRVDANHDGVIDEAEAQAVRKAMFDRVDTNHDGYITQDEAEAARQRWRQRAEAAGHKLPERAGSGTWFAKADTDGDRRISWAEFDATGHDRLFQRFDLNHDGMITREEFLTARGAPRPQ